MAEAVSSKKHICTPDIPASLRHAATLAEVHVERSSEAALMRMAAQELDLLQRALARMAIYGMALELIANHPTADSWECKPLAEIAREASRRAHEV